ncbi:hypothetical protein D1872_244180 [compost metagenome]
MSLQLVDLQIPEDWQVKWNHFYDVPPASFVDDSFPHRYELVEDIFYFKSEVRKRSLDLGWYPEMSPTGEYALYLLRIGQDGEDWAQPIIEYRTKDITQVIRKIQEIFEQVQAGIL